MSTNLETLENVWNSNRGGLVFAQYAEALHREGRGREAQSVLSEGLQKWPRHFAGKILLGRLLEEVGNLDAARAAFQDAVSIDNNSPAALRSLAVVLGKQQYQRQAIDLWVRLSLLDPNNPESAANARKMIADLETTSSLADLGLGVRDVEDAASREALSEGTSSGFPTRGLSGLESNSPLAGWNSEGALASPDPVFDLGDLAFPTPPSIASPIQSTAASTTNWSPNTEIESGTHPMLDPVSEAEPPKPLLGPTEDSGFATLEMASFPARNIPPPPLELPRPLAVAGNESDTRIMNPVPPLPPPGPVVVRSADEPDATQAMPRPTASAAAPVTGDDIGARLDALFADSDAEPGSVVETVAELPATPVAPVKIDLPVDLATAPTSAMEVPTRVSGEDVADRLSELFGSPSETAELLAPPAPEPPPAARQSTSAPRAAVTGNDIEARLDDLFGASEVDLPVMTAPVEPPPAPSAPTAALPGRETAAVSGRDIADRLDSLFGSEEDVRKDTLSSSDTSAIDRSSILADLPSETAEATLENMRAFETAAAPIVHGLSQRPEETRAFEPAVSDPSSADANALLADVIDPSDVDSGGSTLDLPTVGDLPSTPPPAATTGRLTGQDLDSQLDELFASSEFLLDDAPAPAPRKAAPSPTGPVTGDDIGDRLDDLFGSDSDVPAGVPTVTLAEEYLRQGYKDQALAVYRQLAARDPSNSEISRRIADIEAAGN